MGRWIDLKIDERTDCVKHIKRKIEDDFECITLN